VVVTAGYPLDSGLLLKSTEQASVNRPATDVFTTVAEEVVVIVEVDILNHGNVEEEESVTLAWIRCVDQIMLFTEPVDLVWVDTVVAVNAEAI
jgi:hypothetical protein